MVGGKDPARTLGKLDRLAPRGDAHADSAGAAEVALETEEPVAAVLAVLAMWVIHLENKSLWDITKGLLTR